MKNLVLEKRIQLPWIILQQAIDVAEKEKMVSISVDKLCIQNIRTFASDVVHKSKSGHPGAPMGCAPMAHVLFTRSMKMNPNNAKWFNRDRFVLSNIILMLADDVACDARKRYPGTVYNNEQALIDLYGGFDSIEVDYRGYEVTFEYEMLQIDTPYLSADEYMRKITSPLVRIAISKIFQDIF
jgi:hypothetical protein